MDKQTIGGFLQRARRQISAADSLLLLSQNLRRDLAWLLAHEDDALTLGQWHTLEKWLQERKEGVPLAYLTGRCEFYSLSLEVTRDVLIPRPETELLVDCVLEKLTQKSGAVADLGTGSGCVALAVKSEQPATWVVGVDISAQALSVAQKNARRLQLDVCFVQADWLSAIAPHVFQIIAANPPYVAEDDSHFSSLRHEPRLALAGSGLQGLGQLQHLVRQAKENLQPGGWLILEHGWHQGAQVLVALENEGFRQVSSRKDLAGWPRISLGQYSPS